MRTRIAAVLRKLANRLDRPAAFVVHGFGGGGGMGRPNPGAHWGIR